MRPPPLLLALFLAFTGCETAQSRTPVFVHRDAPPDEATYVDASVYPPPDPVEGGEDTQEGGAEEGTDEEPPNEGGDEGAGDFQPGEGGGEGEGEPPCQPSEEVCNGLDDDCDGERDEGLSCSLCEINCPVGALPSDVDLCVAVDTDSDCPAGYDTDLGTMRSGTPTLDLACTPCSCDAEATPIQHDRTIPDCSVSFQRDPVMCDGEGGGVCEGDLCGDPSGGHTVRLVLSTEGGAPDLDSATCTVRDEVLAKLCCRHSLPGRPPQCEAAAFPGALCPPPPGARGPLLVRESGLEPAVCAAAEIPGALVFTELVVQGAVCAPCPCQAQATISLCDGAGESLTCTATGAEPVCTTDCLFRPDPGGAEAQQTGFRTSITMARSGEAPALTFGECVPTDPRWVCDPRRVLLDVR